MDYLACSLLHADVHFFCPSVAWSSSDSPSHTSTFGHGSASGRGLSARGTTCRGRSIPALTRTPISFTSWGLEWISGLLLKGPLWHESSHDAVGEHASKIRFAIS